MDQKPRLTYDQWNLKFAHYPFHYPYTLCLEKKGYIDLIL